MQGNGITGVTDLILAHNIEELCSILTDWMKQHYSLDIIGFFFKDEQMPQALCFVKNDPMNVARRLEELLAEGNTQERADQEILFFFKGR